MPATKVGKPRCETFGQVGGNTAVAAVPTNVRLPPLKYSWLVPVLVMSVVWLKSWVTAAGLIVSVPYVWKSATLAVLVAPSVIDPLPWFVNRVRTAGVARPGATVSAPPLPKLRNVVGPIWLMTALLDAVTPLMAVPPLTAKVPGPPRNPPMIVELLSVAVWPAAT